MSTLIVNHYTKTNDDRESRYITLTDSTFFGLCKITIKTFCFKENPDGSLDEAAISWRIMEQQVADFIVKEGYCRPGYTDKILYNTTVYFTGIGKWNYPDHESYYFSFKELRKQIKEHPLRKDLH